MQTQDSEDSAAVVLWKKLVASPNGIQVRVPPLLYAPLNTLLSPMPVPCVFWLLWKSPWSSLDCLQLLEWP